MRNVARVRPVAVCRVRVLRADGTVEDRGVVSLDFRWWHPADLYKVFKNLRQFGWRRSR